MKLLAKKITVFLLSLLLLSCLTGCSTPEASVETAILETTQRHPEKEELLADWFFLLETHERIYSGFFRTLDYMEMYTSDHSWESLLKARASVSSVQLALQEMELPAPTLTSAEIKQFLPEDNDAITFLQEFEMLETIRADKEITAAKLSYTLEDDVFLRASVEDAIPTMTEFYQDYFTLEYRYICQFTNYLLLKLDCTEVWEDWKVALPCMASCADNWYNDTWIILKETQLLQDSMSTLLPRMGNILGTSEFTLEIVQEAVQTGDLSALQREINDISGVTGYFPIPAWLPDVPYLYLVTDSESGEKRLVNMGEELSSVPSACYIACDNISIEDVDSYADLLTLWNIPSYISWNDTQDTCSVLVNSGSSTMMIEWTAEETILYLTEPVGCLIPELYLQAIISK